MTNDKFSSLAALANHTIGSNNTRSDNVPVNDIDSGNTVTLSVNFDGTDARYQIPKNIADLAVSKINNCEFTSFDELNGVISDLLTRGHD